MRLTPTRWDSRGRVGGRAFRSLRTGNYRLYFFGQMFSSIGTWVQLVAEHWLVIQLGGGGLALGVTTALQFTPLLLLGAYAGVVVDRWDKRRLLLLTQSANGLLALVLAVLAMIGFVQVWMVWVAALLLGCVNSFDNPGRQALTNQMVGSEHVSNAVSLNNAISNTARAVGPAVGGLLLATVGSAVCFAINAASYAAVVLCLRVMDRTKFFSTAVVTPAKGQVREGFRYVMGRPVLWVPILVMTIVSTFGINYQVVLPVLVSETFQYGPGYYGTLMSALGIGSVVGAIVAAMWDGPTSRRVGWLAVLFGLTSLGVAVAGPFAVALIMIVLMGVASGMFLSACTGCLQINSSDEMLGRVMSLYCIGFLGVSPFSGPLVGWVAQDYGAPATFWLAAVACMAAGLIPLVAKGTDARAGRQTCQQSEEDDPSEVEDSVKQA